MMTAKAQGGQHVTAPLDIDTGSQNAHLGEVAEELARFEREEKRRLGLPDGDRHWRDGMINPQFSKSQRAETTLLVSGLTAAHDHLVKSALRGLGYNVEVIDVPDNEALRYGKEFGNRGQCNPTYYTVGNLVKFLTERCRDEGLLPAQAVERYVFVTAGACGPCRFGMYATEYRKALRDAGFDGFRVMLFQQQGGLAQATGQDAGLELSPKFFIGILKALMAGDVLNGIGYRIRPFEIEPGSTDAALARARAHVERAFADHGSLLLALVRARRELAAVKCDFTRPAPRVSIIGEFWAMTTEGDGNYKLQRFLEEEGAECDVQFVTNWLLYNIWEVLYDTHARAQLRGQDSANASIKGSLGRVELHRATMVVADLALRAVFQTFAHVAGLPGYHLPDMNQIATTAHEYYDNRLRGGEGHMEVGKFILNVLHNKSHMTLSVKPFGCMPSSGISDGVQSLITARFPQSLFCAIETSGDGKVNVQSRVQMQVFKARQKATAEYDEALARAKVTREQVQRFFAEHPRYASPLHRSPHGGAGTAVDRLVEIVPLIGKSPLAIRAIEARRGGERLARRGRAALGQAVHGAKALRGQARPLLGRLKASLKAAAVKWGTSGTSVSAPAVEPTGNGTKPVRSTKLSVVSAETADEPHPARPAPPPPPSTATPAVPALAKAPAPPVTEPTTDPASALSVVRGHGTAARDFRWLAENIPCQAACPAHTDIPAYLKAIAEGRYDDAYAINLRDNVFPGVMGRVCSRPCEAACRHGWDGLGEPVAICWSKRAAADLRPREPMVLPPLAGPTGKRVVVVGAGPAGLAAARTLALLGHQVVVLEQHDRPGGMMVQDIPEFRLPRDVVELEIEQIRRCGVEIRCGVALGRDVTLAELEAEHDAVVLAAGTLRPNLLDIPGKELRGIEHGVDFLLKITEGKDVMLGEHVLVIGGGFTAMDCARTAARLGATTVQLGEAPGGRGQVPALKLGAETVRVLYRRSKEEMLVTPGEIDDLNEEGMELELMVAPVAYLAGDDGRVAGMRFVRTRMGATDASGRRKPEPIPGSEFDLPATTVLLATGQFPDGGILGDDGRELLAKDGWLASGSDHRTRRAKVFAAGDFATGARTLIDAIGHAKACALVVDEALLGRRRLHEVALVENAKSTGRTREMDAVPRRKMRLLPVLDRGLRAEVERGFEREHATDETTRCYLCHHKMEIDPTLCTNCDLCLNVKPRADCIVKVSGFSYDDAGRIRGFTRATDEDARPRIWINQSECIRCGACIDVCPDDAISLQKVSLRTVAAPGALRDRELASRP